MNGTVVAIRAEDTDLVERGQVLLELDDADARVALQAAEAALAEAVREVRGLYPAPGNRLRSSPSAPQTSSACARRPPRAGRTAARTRRLRTSGSPLSRPLHFGGCAAGRRSTLQSAQAARAAAQAAIREAESALVQAASRKAVRGAGRQHLAGKPPRVAAAASQVRAAYLALIRTKVVAPVRGYIARRSVQLGERVSTGNALMAVVPASELWVEANFRKPIPGRTHRPARNAELRLVGQQGGLSRPGGRHVRRHRWRIALLLAQNASGNWIKIVQRVPVRIALDPAELAEHPLRIGLSMRVSIDTHDREGSVLAASPRLGGGIETPVFADQLEAADSLIESVITANRSANGRR